VDPAGPECGACAALEFHEGGGNRPIKICIDMTGNYRSAVIVEMGLDETTLVVAAAGPIGVEEADTDGSQISGTTGRV